MSESMRFAFSSQMCPHWDFGTLVAKAREYGYDGITLAGFVDDSISPLNNVFLTDPQKLRKQFEDAGLRIASIASRITPTGSRAKDLKLCDDVRRFIDRAADLNSPSVRVLDPLGKTGQSRADLIHQAAEWLLPLADEAAQRGVQLLVQNAHALNRSRDLWALLDYSVHPALGAAWDQLAAWPETSSVSIPALNSRLFLPILRDADISNGSIQWKNLGDGRLEVSQSVLRLKGIGFRGFTSFEVPPCDNTEEKLKEAILKLREWTKPKDPPKPKAVAKPAAKPAATAEAKAPAAAAPVSSAAAVEPAKP